MFELTDECRRCHSLSRAGALHQGVERSCVYAEHQGNSQHVFVADEADLEIAMAVDSDQRDEVVGGKEDMTNALPGPGTHIAKAQLNLLAACQQMLTTRAGETGKQTTSRDGDDMNSLSRSGTNWFVCGAARTVVWEE